MNRENREQYQVVIQAKDMGGQMGGLSGTTTVNITLTDVNDNPPRFPQSKLSLTAFLQGKSFRVKKEKKKKKQLSFISFKTDWNVLQGWRKKMYILMNSLFLNDKN